ncbi:hypothetical protein HK100_005876 [Physocladia obscura]|uniref:SHSP domain-containing protein n=1 Tax=Physocladia obscura TaxID=109957 RepID=A0AAD5T7E4_9FUNG|nr:hypothetical protein HK100_005876 [Physocladia obscura]
MIHGKFTSNILQAGKIIDTPFFKFNSDGDRSATASSTTGTTTVGPHSVEINATPKILANGRVSLEIDLPGFAKEDVELSYNSDENVIELKGTREGNESNGRTERRVDAKIPVPPEADVGDIHAAMEHGVLKIDLGRRVVSGRPVVIE